MNLVKKCDTRTHLSPGRNKTQHTPRRTGQAEKANASAMEPDRIRPIRRTFAEDFMLEHSHPGLQIAAIGISGISGAAPQESQKPTQCFGFPA
jgi:hypothetical protein